MTELTMLTRANNVRALWWHGHGMAWHGMAWHGHAMSYCLESRADVMKLIWLKTRQRDLKKRGRPNTPAIHFQPDYNTRIPVWQVAWRSRWWINWSAPLTLSLPSRMLLLLLLLLVRGITVMIMIVLLLILLQQPYSCYHCGIWLRGRWQIGVPHVRSVVSVICERYQSREKIGPMIIRKGGVDAEGRLEGILPSLDQGWDICPNLGPAIGCKYWTPPAKVQRTGSWYIQYRAARILRLIPRIHARPAGGAGWWGVP